MNKLIREYHKLYAKYKRPEYLEIASDLGKVKQTETFEEIWMRRANKGAIDAGLPKIYP